MLYSISLLAFVYNYATCPSMCVGVGDESTRHDMTLVLCLSSVFWQVLMQM